MNDYKIHKSKDYTIVCNSIFRNYGLSYKAKGLLLQMLSLPDNWDWSAAGLSAMATDGRDGVETGLRELEKAGYLTRTQRRSSDGKLDGYTYDVYENPITAEPVTEKPSTDNPHNKILNNKILSNTSTTTARESEEDLFKVFLEWLYSSMLKEQAERTLFRESAPHDLQYYAEEFFDNDFSVRERVLRRERTDVLKHFQSWLSTFIIKEKENANNSTDKESKEDIERRIREQSPDYFS